MANDPASTATSTSTAANNIELLIKGKIAEVKHHIESCPLFDYLPLGSNPWQKALNITKDAFTDPDMELKDSILWTTSGIVEILERTSSFNLDEMEKLLIAKNRAYGNSLFEPAKIASQMTASQRIAVQYDCKVNRLQKGGEFAGDDTLVDMVGYGIMWLICLDLEGAQ